MSWGPLCICDRSFTSKDGELGHLWAGDGGGGGGGEVLLRDNMQVL